MLSDLRMYELLMTKFCHDLAGPLGALGNGVEFLQEMKPDMHDRAISLMEVSSKESLGRLQFYRAAYGSTPDQGTANMAKLRQATLEYFATSKVSIDWDEAICMQETLQIPHRVGKLLLNNILLCSAMLIYGGKLHIDLTQATTHRTITLQGTAGNVKNDPDIGVLLFDKEVVIPITVRNVQTYYIRKLSEEMGATLRFTAEAEQVSLKILY